MFIAAIIIIPGIPVEIESTIKPKASFPGSSDVAIESIINKAAIVRV